MSENCDFPPSSGGNPLRPKLHACEKALAEMRGDRDFHRDNEERLREAIWYFGMDHKVGSPERKWASEALYGV